MPSDTTMNVNLSRDLYQFVKAAVKSGRYTSASEVVREALREHLRRLELRASEERDRQGYSRQSQTDAETRGWEAEATWPEE